MPAAPSAAPAAPPTSSSFLVSFMALGRLDLDEPADEAVEVAQDLAVGERPDHMLADRVQAPVVAPRIEDVPLVDAAVDRVHRGRDRAEAACSVRVAEAGHGRLAHLAADDLRVLAARDLRAARVAPEVHVHVLAGPLVPEGADEVALALPQPDAGVPLP